MKLLSSISSTLLIFLNILGPVQAQDSTGYGPDHYDVDHDLKEELNLVYIGASWCVPCLDDSLKQALEEIKLLLYEKTKTKEMNYSVIGIANDESVERGWNFLNGNGYFDEFILGKKWINSGSIDLIWNQEPVKPAVPQIIVFSRSIEYGKGIEIGEKNILVRKAGKEAINEWLDEGAPLNYD